MTDTDVAEQALKQGLHMASCCNDSTDTSATQVICIDDCGWFSYIYFSWFDLQRLFEWLQHLDHALFKLCRLRMKQENTDYKTCLLKIIISTSSFEVGNLNSNTNTLSCIFKGQRRCMGLTACWSIHNFLIMIWHTTITHPYQAGDSLIINHPVLLLSEPLDTWVCTKHKNKLRDNYLKIFCSLLKSTLSTSEVW